MRPGILTAFLVCLLLASTSHSQSVQYLQPGEFSFQTGTEGERIDGAIKEARWTLGKLFFDPWMSVRNIAYVDTRFNLQLPQNDGGGSNDFTATIGAGLRGYLPVGRRMSFAAHALPEYTWWYKNRERSRVNGRYGVGFFGSAGRIDTEATFARNDALKFVSRELETPVSSRQDQARLKGEIAIVSAFSLFGEIRANRFENLEQEEDFEDLDNLNRDQVRVQVGVAYQFRRSLSLSMGYQKFETTFQDPGQDRDTTGHGPTLGLSYTRPKFSLALNMSLDKTEVGEDLQTIKGDEVRGSLRGVWSAFKRGNLDVFADRNFVYTIVDDSPYYDDTRLGTGFTFRPSTSIGLRVFAEIGSLDFAQTSDGRPRRVDDSTGFGGDISINFHGLGFRIGVTRTVYDSSLPEFDRTVTTTRASLVFNYSNRGFSIGAGGLRIGSGELSPWA